jgi:hypothetical protein
VCAEFNFWADPEAVHVVLESPLQTPILLVPWETCKFEARFTFVSLFVNCELPSLFVLLFLKEWRSEVMGGLKTKEADLMNKIEENILQRKTSIHDGWVSCDALVPAIMLNSRVIDLRLI